MSKKQTLLPLEQKTVVFYDDEIPAVVVEQGEQQVIYVPLSPICDFLGLDWDAQRQRVRRDPVLSEVVQGSVIITAPSADNRGGGPQTLLCLPLDYLNGWLFGISASRVKEELRDKIIRYQRECYRVLANAFLDRPLSTSTSPNASSLIQIREMGRAIMQMAEEQLKFEERLTVHDQRLGKAAMVVGDLTKRVAALEQTIQPGGVINEEQASQLSQAVKTVALELGKKSGRNEFGSVYGEMYRRFGITAYKFLPARRFKEAVDWLTQWYQEITDSSSSAF